MLRCYITDRPALPGPESLLDAIARNVADGVDWIQIREKDLSARELLDLVCRAIVLARTRTPISTKILVNTRLDVALAAGADGAHLPAGSIPPGKWRELVRARVPPGFLIGTSCHAIDEVRAAEAEGADYAVFGPVFSPLSKGSDLAPRGLESLSRAARSVRIPVLALGGITRENASACVSAGAAGVAAISLFQNS